MPPSRSRPCPTGSPTHRRATTAQIVTMLLKHGADIYVRDRWGNSALTDANLSDSDKIYFELLAHHGSLKDSGHVRVDNETGAVLPPELPVDHSSLERVETVAESRRESAKLYECLLGGGDGGDAAAAAEAAVPLARVSEPAAATSSAGGASPEKGTVWDAPAARTLQRASTSLVSSRAAGGLARWRSTIARTSALGAVVEADRDASGACVLLL